MIAELGVSGHPIGFLPQGRSGVGRGPTGCALAHHGFRGFGHFGDGRAGNPRLVRGALDPGDRQIAYPRSTVRGAPRVRPLRRLCAAHAPASVGTRPARGKWPGEKRSRLSRQVMPRTTRRRLRKSSPLKLRRWKGTCRKYWRNGSTACWAGNPSSRGLPDEVMFLILAKHDD